MWCQPPAQVDEEYQGTEITVNVGKQKELQSDTISFSLFHNICCNF